jgi:hypothetical protein
VNPAFRRAPRHGLVALASLASLVSLVACAPAPVAPPPVAPPAAPPPAAPPALASELAPDAGAALRIAADVRCLASPELAGRGTGEPGARLAADFVAKRFAELGLAPRGDAASDGGAPGFFQRFDARVGANVAPATVTIALGARKSELAPDAVATADGSASGSVTGPVAIVGWGITAPALGRDEYAGVDVTGRIVLVEDGAPGEPLRDFGSVRYKIRTAREHKAAGVVIVADRDAALPPPPADPSDMGLPAVVVKRSAVGELLAKAGFGPPKGHESTRDALSGGSKPVPGATVTIATSITPKAAEAWNVLAALPARDGSPTAGEWVVVGAHYDHLGHGGTSASRAPGSHEVHPGADDNASGTALLLEVARRLARLPARPSRNVLFAAFGAEELGAIGSRFWVDHPTVPKDAIVGMINADMVGRLRDRHLVVDGAGTSAGWPALLHDANAGLGLDLAIGAEGFGASDHASFTAAKVPVAFLFTGVHDDYHRPTDTADKINADGEATVALLAARLAVGVAERRERLAFVDAPSDPHHAGGGRGGGFRVSFGTLPDYAYDGKGLRLSGVRPDAPAARAGLGAGDVIVKVGEHDIGNIHDFMFALGELEPGRAVVVVVLRKGARVSVELIPAPGR